MGGGGIAEGSPFDSPLLSSPGFLTLLCPMLKQLGLCDIRVPIGPDQFAAICQLSNLEKLYISGSYGDEGVCSSTASWL